MTLAQTTTKHPQSHKQTMATATTVNKAIALQEVQETVSRLTSHQGVRAVLILNPEGDIITQSGKQDVIGNTRLLKQMLDIAGRYSASVAATASQDGGDAASTMDGHDDISFISVRFRQDELLIAPKNGFVLVVLQDPAAAASQMD